MPGERCAILDRVDIFETSIADGLKLALTSIDGTLRSNLPAGLPIDLPVYRAEGLAVTLRRRLGEDDACVRTIRNGWSQAEWVPG